MKGPGTSVSLSSLRLLRLITGNALIRDTGILTWKPGCQILGFTSNLKTDDSTRQKSPGLEKWVLQKSRKLEKPERSDVRLVCSTNPA
jgi:hypothetical protein